MKNYVQNSHEGIRDFDLTIKNVHAIPQLQCIQSEQDEGDLLGQGNERGHQDRGEGCMGVGLRKHLKLIQLMREESSALAFVCLSILPLLSYAGTLSKITLTLQWMSWNCIRPLSRCLYPEPKLFYCNYKLVQPNTFLNSHFNYPGLCLLNALMQANH